MFPKCPTFSPFLFEKSGTLWGHALYSKNPVVWALFLPKLQKTAFAHFNGLLVTWELKWPIFCYCNVIPLPSSTKIIHSVLSVFLKFLKKKKSRGSSGDVHFFWKLANLNPHDLVGAGHPQNRRIHLISAHVENIYHKKRFGTNFLFLNIIIFFLFQIWK